MKKTKATKQSGPQLACSSLLAIDSVEGFSIKPPWGWDDEFKPSKSWARTEKLAWKRFTDPSLRREAYEAAGYKPVPITLRFEMANDPALRPPKCGG